MTNDLVFSIAIDSFYQGIFLPNQPNPVKTFGPFRVLVDSDFYVLLVDVDENLKALILAGDVSLALNLTSGSGNGAEVLPDPLVFPIALPIVFFSGSGDDGLVQISLVPHVNIDLSIGAHVRVAIMSVPHKVG